jgi:hypothetical protein
VSTGSDQTNPQTDVSSRSLAALVSGPARKPDEERQRTNTPELTLVTPLDVEVAAPDPGARVAARGDGGRVGAVVGLAGGAPDRRGAEGPIVFRLFDLLDQAAKCEALGREETVVEGSTGQPSINPLLKHAQALRDEARRDEAVLGRGPKRRLDLGIKFGDAAKSLDDLNRRLAGGKQSRPHPAPKTRARAAIEGGRERSLTGSGRRSATSPEPGSSSFLIHGEGDYFGRSFTLTADQRLFLWRWYEYEPGTLGADGQAWVDGGPGRRGPVGRSGPEPPEWRYREGFICCPKGEGKTEFAAGIGVLEFAGPPVIAPRSPNVPIDRGELRPGQRAVRGGADDVRRPEGRRGRRVAAAGPVPGVRHRDPLRRRPKPGRLFRVAAEAGTKDGGKPTLLDGRRDPRAGRARRPGCTR